MTSNLSDLSTSQIEKALQVRKKIDALEGELSELRAKLNGLVGGDAPAKPARKTKRRRVGRPKGSAAKPAKPAKPAAKKAPKKAAKEAPKEAPKGAAPKIGPDGKPKRRGKASTLRDAMAKVMREAGEPVRLQEIHDALVASGFKSKTKDLKKLLSVKLYTDDTFKKVRRGYFKV